MPRIQPDRIFEHLDRELVVHQPFVNDTSVIYVIDMPHVTVSITVEQMLRWGMDVDEVDRHARRNLRSLTPRLEVKMVDGEDGGRAALLIEHDGYDASRLLLNDLYRALAPEMGGVFLVATPARDSFVAITSQPEDFADRMQMRVTADFKRLPYPITDRYFLVTQDGIAGTAA
jgi:uncharacterized protein YtpQ (UPF0354 family)